MVCRIAGMVPWRLCLLVTFLGRTSAVIEKDSKLATGLNAENFNRYLNGKRQDNRKCLVMFHVDWCKVCQRTFPKFANSSEIFKEKGIEMDLAHVDCTNDKSLCTRFEVKGYPSIKLFLPEADYEALPPFNATPRTYKGQRTEEQFLKYAVRMTLPAVRDTFKTFSVVEEALRDETYSAFIIEMPSGGQIPAGIAAVADEWMDRHLFLSTSRLSTLLPRGTTVPKGARLAVVSLGEQQWPGYDNTTASPPTVEFFEGSLDDSAVVSSWVSDNRFAGVWRIGESNFFEITHAKNTVLSIVDPAAMTQSHETAIRAAASSLKDKFNFGVIDGVAWGDELRDFNIASRDLPRVLVAENNFDQWVEDIDELRVESLEQDLQALLAGAPLLRQGRTVWARLMFYRREAERFIVFVGKYASRGIVEKLVVGVGIGAVMGVFLVAGWLVTACVSALSDTDDYQAHRAHQQKKRA